MKNNKLKNTTGESFGIPERRSEGVAGPSREVSRRDAAASGADEAGLANNNAGKSDTPKKITHTAPQLVERKTELRGLHIGATRQPKSTIRRQTEQDLYCRDPEVTYVMAERANHDHVCGRDEVRRVRVVCCSILRRTCAGLLALPLRLPKLPAEGV